MEKQQKIVEMAKDICRVKLNCNDVCNPISACDALKYAERAYEAGYRKQVEMEWTPHRGGGWLCGNCKKYSTGLKPFCSFCGAKMKGGK